MESNNPQNEQVEGGEGQENEEILDDDVNMIWGMSFDDSLEDEVKVTIIATWFEEQSKEQIIKQPKRDILGRPTTPVRRESANGFMRAIETVANQEAPAFTSSNIDSEDETPAFVNKKLNKEKEQGN